MSQISALVAGLLDKLRPTLRRTSRSDGSDSRVGSPTDRWRAAAPRLSLVILVAALVAILVPLSAAARSVPGRAASSLGDGAVGTPSSSGLAAVVPTADAGVASEPAPTDIALPAFANATLPVWAYQPLGYKVVAGIPFTGPVDCGDSLCQQGLDIYVPAGPGPFVTVVLVGPSGRGYLSGLAEDLANRGILVYNADFRDVGTLGGGYPAGFQDVACAVRFARASASQYGGLSGTVALLGHSLGAWVGSVVALDPVEFQGGCLAGGSGRPDAFVGFAGNYQIDSGLNAGDLSDFFGGSPSEMASAYAAANPFNYATGTAIPVQLVAGTADESVDPDQSQALETFLTARGWSSTLTMIPGDGHMSILEEPSTRQAVFKAIAAAYSARHAIDPLMWSQSQ